MEQRESEFLSDAYISERIFETVGNQNQPLTVYTSGKMELQHSAEQKNGDLLSVQSDNALHKERIVNLESQSQTIQT